MNEVIIMIGWKKQTIYKKMQENILPLPEKRGSTSVWKLSLLNKVVEGKTNWEKYNNKIRLERGLKPIYNHKKVA